MVRIRTKIVAAGHHPTVTEDLGVVEFPQMPLEGQFFRLNNGGKRYRRRAWMNVTGPPDQQELWIEELPDHVR